MDSVLDHAVLRGDDTLQSVIPNLQPEQAGRCSTAIEESKLELLECLLKECGNDWDELQSVLKKYREYKEQHGVTPHHEVCIRCSPQDARAIHNLLHPDTTDPDAAEKRMTFETV